MADKKKPGQNRNASGNAPAACPCGGPSYAACCGRFIDAGALPSTAPKLMRSRYTAYVLQKEPYLRKTWCASHRPTGPLFEPPLPQWLGLTIVGDTQDGDTATVEFIARYKTNGRAQKLHEVSRFLREHNDDGLAAWCYLDGQFR